MPIKSRVRVKLPSKTPIFMAKLRDHFSKASVLDDDDDHVVLEFDRAEDAAEALSQPVTIHGCTLEMESLATGGEATHPRSRVRSQIVGILEEKLSAQASEGNLPQTEKNEEGDSGQPQDMESRLRKMGASSVLGQRSSMPPPLPKRKPPPPPPRKPATSKHSAPVPGPGEDDNNRPTLTPEDQRPGSAIEACIPTSKDAETKQRPCPPVRPRSSLLRMSPEETGSQNDGGNAHIRPSVIPRKTTASPSGRMTTEFRGMETGAGDDKDVPSPENFPRIASPPQGGSAPMDSAGLASTPDTASGGVTMWKSSDFDKEEKENNAAPNTDEIFSRLCEQTENTYLEVIQSNVYETMSNYVPPRSRSSSPNPIMPPSTGSSMLDGTQYDVIQSYQLFGEGNDLSIPQERAPQPPEDQPRHGKVSKPPAASESPFRQSPSSAENQARWSRPPNRPLPEIPIVQNAPLDEELSPHIYDSLPDCSSMFDYGSTSRQSDLDKGLDDINYSLRFDQDDEIANVPLRDHDRKGGAVENAPQPSHGQEAPAGADRGQGSDDDDDDDGPPELGAYLEAVKRKHPQKGAEDTASKDKPKSISQRLSLSVLHVKLLTAMGKLSPRPGVEVRWTPDGKVFLEGEEKAVLHMERAMQADSKSLHPVPFSLPPERLDLLQWKTHDARDALARLNIRGTWVVHDDQVYVAGADDPQLLVDVLEQQLEGEGPRSSSESAVTRSLTLEDELLASSSGPFRMGEAFEYLKKNQDNLFGSLGRDDDPHLTVTLSQKDGCHYVTVKGKESVVENVLAIARTYLEDVMQDESVLRDAAVTRVWKTGRSEEVIHAVQSKFPNYVITADALPEESSAPEFPAGNVSGSDTSPSDSDDSDGTYDPSDDEISNSPAPLPSTPAGQSQAAKMDGSVLLVLPAMEVRREDLLKLHVDAIVHGTDEQLTFGTKLGKELLQTLGAGVQQKCQDHVQKHGPLPAGSVFCTDTGRRSECTTVVHASLPKATNGLADGRLKDTVVAALNAVKAEGLRTVALPALGAKSCDISPVDAALSVIQGVAAFSLTNPAHGLHHVILCDLSEDSHRVFKAVLPEVWALDSERLKASLNLNASLLLADSRLQKPGSKLPRIQLVLGSIQNQQADVIVNSTRPDLSLDCGAISKSLLKAGGPGLQREIQAKRCDKLIPGKVCVTKGGQLQCREMFHITLPEYGGDEQTKVLARTVSRCLEKAEEAGHRSIAFPPLGIGNVHFPPDVVIQTILKCVQSFRQSHSNPTLVRVTLVAYPGGFNSIQPFRKVMTEFIESDKIDAKAFEVFHKLKVGGVKVEMKTGNITQQKTDAIVNGCQDDMNLEKGLISKAILEAAGQGLQTECSKLATLMAKDKVVVSGPGKLGCKKIIHVVTQTGADHWRVMWPKVFEICKSQNITSLAIPPIGTGGMKLSPWDMGGLLCDAIKKMTSPGSLTNVLVVFPKQDKLDDFAKGFNEKHRGTGLRLPDMTTEEVTLGSLSVAVAAGSITQEENDAIVNFCNTDMDLRKGVLSSVISKAAGPRVQDECNQKKADMQTQQVVVTLSGSLKCKKVIHLPRADSAAKLSEFVKRAVCTARDKHLNEISIPAPTIAGRFDAVKVADAMFHGLKMAGSTDGTTVRVRIVLYSADVIGAFVQQLRTQAKTSQTSSLPARMRRVYSERRRDVRRVSSFPRVQRTGAAQESVDLKTCTVPVRVRVTGLGNEVRSVANEVLKQCQGRVTSL